MRIKFLGAAGTVTGSGYVLTADSGESILIDLGMFQGLPRIESLNYQPIECDFGTLSGMLLTHAHLDHCGRLPMIFTGGFGGKVWMTPATKELAQIVLLDSAKIAHDDEEHALYDQGNVEQAFGVFNTMDYHQEFTVGPFKVMFYDAGHILGSSSIKVTDQRSQKSVVFSGDLGNPAMDLLPHAEAIENADAVVMESTYGDRLHPLDNPMEAIGEEIRIVEAKGGTLLIPAFSLEKTQEILHWIKMLKLNRKVNMETPVFLDSPMAIRATNVYRGYSYLYTPELQAEFKTSDPFDFEGLEITMSSKKGKRIDSNEGPKVIIAGSGMMMGGRILKHATRYLPMPNTRMLLVGYQGEGTLGKEIDEGKRRVEIYGKLVNIKAQINRTQTMSSHADQGQLLDWLKNIQGIKTMILTHGDNEPRQVLANTIESKLGLPNVKMPMMNDEIEL